MEQRDFELSLERFFTQSSIPTTLWKRLLEKEALNPQGILEIPGRMLFALETKEQAAESLALRKHIPIRVIFQKGQVKVSDGLGETHALSQKDFNPLHPIFQTALALPSRQVRVAAARELTATASSLMNKLALADPTRQSEPSNWMPLIIDLMRLGVYQDFVGNTQSLSLSDSPKNAGDTIEFLNRRLDRLPKRAGEVGVSLPGWITPLAIDLAEAIIDFGYSKLSASALGAFLHKLGNATGETGIWGHFADGESLKALTGPVMDLLRSRALGSEFNSFLENCVFLDPTDSPGSILAEMIESVSDSVVTNSSSEQQKSLLAPEKYTAWVSNLDLGRVNALSIWFALAKSWLELGLPIYEVLLDNLWENVSVKVGNQLEADWESIRPNEDCQLVVVGSPKFAGTNKQSSEEKQSVELLFGSRKVDYSACWLKKGSDLVSESEAIAAFVLTNSVCQGEQVSLIWPKVISDKVRIAFARPSIKWAGQLDGHSSTGVTVVVVGLESSSKSDVTYYGQNGTQKVRLIGPYLIPNIQQTVSPVSRQISGLPRMVKGNMAFAESLIFDQFEFESLLQANPESERFIKRLVGSNEIAKSSHRYCIWIPNEETWLEAKEISGLRAKVEQSRKFRETSTNKNLALTPWRFREITETRSSSLVIPSVTSESRDYIPIDFVGTHTIVSNLAFAVYESPGWLFSLLTSRSHGIWLRLVSGGLETRLRYSNRLSYNTFPAPTLSAENKGKMEDLGLDIVDSRGMYPEVSLGQLYSSLPLDLKQAHQRNDEYIANLYGISDPENVELTINTLMDLYVRKLGNHAD
jgi:hypothetical protein